MNEQPDQCRGHSGISLRAPLPPTSGSRAARRPVLGDTGHFVYDFGGLEIQSAIPLAGFRALRDGGSRPILRLFVERGRPSPTRPPIFRWPGPYGLTLAAHGRGWLISSRHHGSVVVSEDGLEVRCYPDGATTKEWPDVVVRRILPRLMQRHGQVVLHAAALSDGRSAVLLLGPSHSGKSTLTAALNHYLRWPVFSDDLAAIDHLRSPPVCLPVGAGVCLLPDSLAAFSSPAADSRQVAGHEYKRWQSESAGDQPMAPRPLRCIFLLTPVGSFDASADQRPAAEGVGGVSLRRVPAVDAACHASANLILFNPADAALQAQAWKGLGQLVSKVPAFALSYPRRYDSLPSVVDAIRKLMTDADRLRA
jgi:hypothetical protein